MNLARIFGLVWNMILVIAGILGSLFVFSRTATYVSSITSPAAFDRGFMVFILSAAVTAMFSAFAWPLLWQLRARWR